MAHLPVDKWGMPILSVGHVLRNTLTGKFNEVIHVDDNHLYTGGGNISSGYYYHLAILGTDKTITLTPAMICNFNWLFRELDCKEYKDSVINTIVAMFSIEQRVGVHKVDYKYIEGMVSSFINEHREEDLPHPTIIDTCWSDCYQDNEPVMVAVKKMFEGCKTLYHGHMSVL